MNVYTLEGCGRYGGGMAVVAANTIVEAWKVAATIEDDIWHTDYKGADVHKLDGVEASGEPRVLCHYEMGE